ncbi:FtsH-binding integral membrane protein [Oikeobacillus pervagus]|uniref:FtsH-binding integral membrane protein n=1 Tax=Oikeobacillus pervagus TaxID=1325931 RepID=A0AAJ1T3C0_9BACI|nr:Bax inhibitor-1/YccA family protein [Oikeobacillus pervagus]MDQ0214100.1 FtsH-binding integral membrane protein [Oikeobacillus pervagus]
MYSEASYDYMPSVLKTFAISLSFSLLGMVAGVFVPPSLIIPLVVVEFIMLLSVMFFRRRKAISYTFLYVFTFISGITIYPAIAYYLSSMGANLVLGALGTTVVIFTGLGVYATKTKRDFSFLGGFLMAALLALIVLGIFNFFSPLTSTAMLVYSFIGVLVFSGFVLYDFNMMKKYGVTAEEVPLMALNLYLDFINIFLDLLRFFNILSDD